jgi:hypothetical protein
VFLIPALKKPVLRIFGLVIGIPAIFIGLAMIIYGTFVPAFIAMPFLFVGMILIVGGSVAIWAFFREAKKPVKEEQI